MAPRKRTSTVTETGYTRSEPSSAKRVKWNSQSLVHTAEAHVDETDSGEEAEPDAPQETLNESESLDTGKQKVVDHHIGEMCIH
jgi:hypothetical protein